METTAVKVPHWLALGALSVGIASGALLAQVLTPELDDVATCPAPVRRMDRLELLFGTSRADGTSVTRAQWQAFLDAEVTPRFPDGFTVLEGPGQWRGGDGRLTREQAHILVVGHTRNATTEGSIEAIRASYKAQFEQESVMRVNSVSCVAF